MVFLSIFIWIVQWNTSNVSIIWIVKWEKKKHNSDLIGCLIQSITEAYLSRYPSKESWYPKTALESGFYSWFLQSKIICYSETLEFPFHLGFPGVTVVTQTSEGCMSEVPWFPTKIFRPRNDHCSQELYGTLPFHKTTASRLWVGQSWRHHWSYKCRQSLGTFFHL